MESGFSGAFDTVFVAPMAEGFVPQCRPTAALHRTT